MLECLSSVALRCGKRADIVLSAPRPLPVWRAAAWW
jgi:hypothetical protein